MNKYQIMKLIETNLLDCENLMLIDIVYKGKGRYGYIFKINELPLVIKVIPKDKEYMEKEFIITKYLYELFKTQHKINTILKPYVSFECDTNNSKFTQIALKTLKKSKVTLSAFYDNEKLKDNIYVFVYKWANEGDLGDFIMRKNIKETTLIKILLTIFCTLKIMKDSTNGKFLHNDLHIYNILIENYKKDIYFDYNFKNDKDELKVSFKNNYKPLLADFSMSIVKNKFNKNSDFNFSVFHDVFKLANHLLEHSQLINNSEKIIEFLEFIVPKYFRYPKIIHNKRVIVSNFNLHLESENIPFKKSIEDIIKHPIFSKYVKVV